MSPLRSLSLIAVLLVSAALAGCGGGGTPTTDHVSTKGTTTLNVYNDLASSGTLSIGGASFTIHSGDSLTLSNMTVGHTYSWTFTTAYSKRGGSKRISGISYNALTIR